MGMQRAVGNQQQGRITRGRDQEQAGGGKQEGVYWRCVYQDDDADLGGKSSGSDREDQVPQIPNPKS